MTIDFAVITTYRLQSTIAKSIESLRRAGHGGFINIFAEPNTEFVDMPGTNFIYNQKQLGCFGNYHRALTSLCENSDATHICVLSDDFQYSQDLFKSLAKITHNENFCYAALFTPAGMSLQPCRIRKHGWSTMNMGWKNSWGGLYLFKKSVAKDIIAHDFYTNHLANYEANQQIDHCIPEVCFQLGLDQWFSNPSLADHIGNTSTIGHVHTKWSQGLHFRP